MEETDHHVKCTRQHVVIVAMNVKYHLSQDKTNQSIVMTASRITNQKEDNQSFLYKYSIQKLLNFNCVFPSCDFKKNDIEEEEFLKHLNDVHHDEMVEVSERESIPINMVEMISVSNSTVFINSG